MSKGKKHIAAVFALIVVFAALVLSGCMPGMTGTGTGTGTTTGAGEGSGSGGLTTFLPLIAIVVVFYFLLIRPQNKKNKQVNEMRNAIKRGDYVTTIGGFRGRVTRVADDLIVIEVGANKVKLEIMRWGISKIEQAAPESKISKEEDVQEDEAEVEQPKRKPKKLAPVAKKESKPEQDAEYEDGDLADEEDKDK